MLRPLLLAILGSALLCVFFGVPQQPLLAEGGGMQSHTPKQPQMDVPPAVSSLTASQLQTVWALSQKTDALILSDGASPSRTLYFPAVFFRNPIQASTVLRI